MTDPEPAVVAIVPAAGASRRFGTAKLLHDVGGVPLLTHTLRSLLDAGLTRVILVVSPPRALATVPLVADPRVVVVVNPDPERGMFSSILVGLAELLPAQAALVLPADMPFVRPETVALLMSVHRQTGEAVVAAYRGRRGHPLIMPPGVCRAVRGQAVVPGLKSALATVGVEPREVDVVDPGVVRDVDEPRDLP